MRPHDTPQRLDRWLTLSVVRPLSALRPAHAGPRVPILMYHSIADDVDDGVHPYFRTVTTPRRFEQQVAHLVREGYQAVTLSEAVGMLRAGMPASGARPVVITFDDGFRDFHTEAFPVLERAGFRATVFLATDYVGKTFLTGRHCLDRNEVRELARQGIEFGSHSASHRRLGELPRRQLCDELGDSKAAIEDIIGHPATLFSYPYRFPEEDTGFTQLLAELLGEAGYAAGVTTSIGRARREDPAFFLPRLPVNDCDDLGFLAAKLNGHYDWVHTGQLLRKQARSAWRRGLRTQGGRP